MLFKPYHVYPVVTDEETYQKTESRRIWTKPRVTIGSIQPAMTKMLVKSSRFAEIEILELYEQALEEMTEDNARREGGYTLEMFKFLWQRINKVPFNPKTVVWVIVFRRVTEFPLLTRKDDSVLFARTDAFLDYRHHIEEITSAMALQEGAG